MAVESDGKRAGLAELLAELRAADKVERTGDEALWFDLQGRCRADGGIGVPFDLLMSLNAMPRAAFMAPGYDSQAGAGAVARALRLVCAKDAAWLKNFGRLGFVCLEGADASKASRMFRALTNGMQKEDADLLAGIFLSVRCCGLRTGSVIAASRTPDPLGEDKRAAFVKMMWRLGAGGAPGYYHVDALSRSAYSGGAVEIETMLSLGADPNGLDRNGMSPLILAARGGGGALGKRILGSLLSAGADPNLPSDPQPYGGGTRFSPLAELAFHSGSVEDAKMLLAAGADPGFMIEDAPVFDHKRCSAELSGVLRSAFEARGLDGTKGPGADSARGAAKARRGPDSP